MELNESRKLLEQLKEKCDNSNLKNILFITDRKNALLTGSFNRTDIINMLTELLNDMEQIDRVEIINAVLRKFIK